MQLGSACSAPGDPPVEIDSAGRVTRNKVMAKPVVDPPPPGVTLLHTSKTTRPEIGAQTLVYRSVFVAQSCT
jgi:hypothetical protein